MINCVWHQVPTAHICTSNALSLLNTTIRYEGIHLINTKLQPMYNNKLHRYPQETKVMSLSQTPSCVNNISYLF